MPLIGGDQPIEGKRYFVLRCPGYVVFHRNWGGTSLLGINVGFDSECHVGNLDEGCLIGTGIALHLGVIVGNLELKLFTPWGVFQKFKNARVFLPGTPPLP